ncbi:MAG TPA: tetratricopeptide repeat protein [Gemmatimonadales bacterium]|nr:tetratricopeptide repeat protein [Gemmatimonadales bacterium]
MRKLIGLVIGTLVLASALAGQGWVPAKCDIKPGNYLVNSAVLYLKNAAQTRFDDQKKKDLSDANRSLTQALTSGGQDKNPAAWYYLGRYYVIQNDAYGADSAFDRAEALFPACKDDIWLFRRNALWVPAFNAGVAALNAQQYDSAVAAFRRAAVVYDEEPQGLTTLATAFFNMPAETYLPESTFRRMNPAVPDSQFQAAYDAATRTRYDSAAKYFRLGIVAAQDPKFARERSDAMFNLANSFYAAQRYDSAASGYAEYLKVMPNDAQALARLGDVLQTAGQKDSAMSVYATIIAHADSMDALSLFNAGVSIYNGAPPFPDTVRVSADCRRSRAPGRTPAQRRLIVAQCDSVAADSVKKREATAAQNYSLAAQAFEAGLAHNAQSRDGLFNLANAYLALRQPDKMLPVAQRLVAIDPMNRNSVRLVAQAWALKSRSDSALHYVTLSDSLLPVDVTVASFAPGEQNVSLSGLIANYHSSPSTPLTLVFEFLDASGKVVATQTVDVPAIPAEGNHAFQTQAIGAGIIAWRYKKG